MSHSSSQLSASNIWIGKLVRAYLRASCLRHDLCTQVVAMHCLGTMNKGVRQHWPCDTPGVNAVACLQWGRVSNTASEDVNEGVLIRSHQITHSTHFDQRMVILVTVSQSATTSTNVGGQNQRGGTITVQV